MTCREAGKKGGRPTKLSEEVGARICEAVANGWSQEAAAGAVGITERALLKWIAWGNQGKQPYVRFVQDLQQARAKNEGELLAIVSRHAQEDWRAAQWLLSVKVPKRYANLVKHEMRFAAMTDDELDAYIAAAEAQILADSEGGTPLAVPALPEWTEATE